MSRRPVRVSERTRNLEFDSMFIFKNGKVTLNTDESLSTNSAGQIIINPGGGLVDPNIPILTSAPAPVAGKVVPWVLTGDYATIQLLYPDNSNHNKQIVLSDIIFVA